MRVRVHRWLGIDRLLQKQTMARNLGNVGWMSLFQV
jgi:hypothetical protein